MYTSEFMHAVFVQTVCVYRLPGRPTPSSFCNEMFQSKEISSQTPFLSDLILDGRRLGVSDHIIKIVIVFQDDTKVFI